MALRSMRVHRNGNTAAVFPGGIIVGGVGLSANSGYLASTGFIANNGNYGFRILGVGQIVTDAGGRFVIAADSFGANNSLRLTGKGTGSVQLEVPTAATPDNDIATRCAAVYVNEAAAPDVLMARYKNSDGVTMVTQTLG